MKKTSKILAIILAILMVITTVPIIASAEEITENYDYTVISEEDKTCRLNGDDGISRTDSLVLEIPSEVDGYKVIELADNFEYYSIINKIVVPDSVEKIGGAFSGDGSLYIELGAGVSDFEAKNFSNMNNLKEFIVSEDNPYICSVDGVVFTKDMKTLLRFPTNHTDTMYEIPDDVEVIGERAFSQGWNLTKVEIPDSVTTIEKYAFQICSKLERIDMGKGVQTIGDYAFGNCTKLSYVCYAGTEEDFYKISISSRGNANFLNVRFTFDNSDHEHEYVFSEVVPPNCLYDGYTLYVCSICGSEYEDDYIPAVEHVIEVVGETDPTCTEKGYTTYKCVLCNNSYADDYVDKLGHNFEEIATSPDVSECVKNYECTRCGEIKTINGHEKVTIPAKVPTMTETGNTCGEKCANCGEVYKESKVIPMINENSFANLQGDDLIGVLDKEARTLTIYGTGTIEENHNFTATYDKELGMNVGYASYVDTVIITDGVTGIGDDAFSGCPFDTYIIADSVKTIGDSAFFESYAKKIIIGDGVETIGPHAFRSCWYLKELEIGKSVKTMGIMVLLHCDSLETITVDGENQYFSSDEFGVLFDKDKTTLILCPASCKMEAYTIPDTVTTIKENAFPECGHTLTSVIIPKNVTIIEESAFTSIGTMLSPSEFDIYYLGIEEEWNLINNGNGVDIDRYITVHYGENEHLTHHSETVVTPPTCTLKGYSTFICDCGLTYDYDYVDLTGHKDDNSNKYCDSCNEYIGIATGIFAKTLVWTFDDVTGTLTISGKGVMDGFSTKSPWESYEKDIKTVIINEGVTEINDYAFYSCGSIKEVIIHDGLTKIGFSSFESCGLTTITIPDSVTEIDNYAFYSCYKLRNVKYSGSIEQWREITIDTYNQPLFNARKHYNTTETHKIEYAFTVTNPTCMEQGYTTYTCGCGDSYIDDYVDASGHNHISEITTPATHTATGVMTYTCVCGDTYTETIGKLAGHNHNSVVTAPTCTEQGYTTYTCECGDSYIDDYVDALGHTPANAIEENYVAPTCTLTGSADKVTYCSVCDKEINRETEIIETIEHALTEYERVLSAPTCTEEGCKEVVFYCVECNMGISRGTVTLPALGHTNTATVEENYIAPTCTEDGSKDVVVYCSVCEEEISRETVVINATGHADNDNDGYCDNCDEQLCDHACHSDNFFRSLFWRITRFFNKLFGLNKTCECGVAHY